MPFLTKLGFPSTLPSTSPHPAVNHLHRLSTIPHLCPLHRNTTGTREEHVTTLPHCHAMLAHNNAKKPPQGAENTVNATGKDMKEVEHNRLFLRVGPSSCHHHPENERSHSFLVVGPSSGHHHPHQPKSSVTARFWWLGPHDTE